MTIKENTAMAKVEARNVKLSGILWLGSIVSVICSLALVIPNNLALNPLDMAGTFSAINQHPQLHILELVFDEISNLLTLLLAGSLFLGFRRISPTSALMASLLIATGAIVLIIHDMDNFTITWIAESYKNSGATDKLILEKIGYSMILSAKWGVTIGANCIVLGVLLYVFLWTRKQVIPKILGYVGVFCCLVAILASIPYWFDFSLEELGYNLYFPFMIWEIIIGIWFFRLNTPTGGDHD